jgi:hypothetical protein
MEKEKRRQGNPGKYQLFVSALEELFNTDDWNAWVIACSDEELIFMVNQKLEEKDRILDRTFRNYKKGELPKSEGDYEYLRMFDSSYKRALIGQKMIVMQNLAGDSPGAWQKWAWILERKFDEFNMTRKEKVEVNDIGRLVLRGRDSGDGDGGDVL